MKLQTHCKRCRPKASKRKSPKTAWSIRLQWPIIAWLARSRYAL